MLAAAGFEDVLYAVPLGLDKVQPVCALAAKLPGLQVLLDSHAALDALLAVLEQTTTVPLPMGVWLKVDCGYHRAGLEPKDALLLDLAQRIHESQFVRIAGAGLVVGKGGGRLCCQTAEEGKGLKHTSPALGHHLTPRQASMRTLG